MPEENEHGPTDAGTRNRPNVLLNLLIDAIPDKATEHGRLNAKMALRFLSDPDSVKLCDYKFIDDDAAETLALSKRALLLDGVVSLSVNAAKALAKHKGQGLFLNGLTTLSDEAAEALAANNEDDGLVLNGLTSLSDKAAAGLAHFRGCGLFLNGLTSLSDNVAEAFAQFQGQVIFFNGLSSLSSLSDKAAAFLAQRQAVVSGQWISQLIAARTDH
jgi:hypothetical protein